MLYHPGGFSVLRIAARCPPVAWASPLLHLRVLYTTSTLSLRASHRGRSRGGAIPPSRHLSHREAQPARQAAKTRPSFLQRTSLMEQLRDVESTSPAPRQDATAAAASSSSATHRSTLVAPSSHHEAKEQLASPYVTSPHLISAQRQAEVNAAHAATAHRHWQQPQQQHTASTDSAEATALLQLQDQQRALRDAFTHARQHHNVRLRKHPQLYRAECRAFRQAHQGRSPTLQEVTRTVAVPLAPVSALKTLAHTNPKTSALHSATVEAVVLHNAVVKNELVKSNAPQLVRCLRCFHVYTGRPRTLWGGEVGQSGIEYEKVQAQLAADRQLQRRPWLRKRSGSVGRRQRAQQEDPTCCPQCGSPRAQWMMEYVHHHTHEKS